MVTKYSTEILNLIKCNNDIKPLGSLGGTIEATYYSTSYTTKTDKNDLVNNALVIAGFRKRILYETEEQNMNKSKISLGRSRLLSLISKLTSYIKTGLFLAIFYNLIGMSFYSKTFI